MLSKRTIFVGSDHAAYASKLVLIERLEKGKCKVVDMGSFNSDRTDYPEWARAVALEVQQNKGVGILMCGSGIGVSMVANRFANVRAALCRTPIDAELSRKHNDANILCVGTRINSDDEIFSIAEYWLEAEFEGERHADRITLFNHLGEKLPSSCST